VRPQNPGYLRCLDRYLWGVLPAKTDEQLETGQLSGGGSGSTPVRPKRTWKLPGEVRFCRIAPLLLSLLPTQAMLEMLTKA